MKLLNAVPLMISALIAANAAAAVGEVCPVSGLVIDRQSREGIANASVTVIGADDVRVVTDSLGHFTLNLHQDESCRFIAVHQKYSSGITDAVTVSRCTPFIRIELDRQIRKSSEQAIDRMIQLADVMKKEECYDSLYVAYYAEHLAALASYDNIRNGRFPLHWKYDNRQKEKKSLDGKAPQFMLLRNRTVTIHKTEYAEGQQGSRRQQHKEAKRPNLRYRPVKKEDA